MTHEEALREVLHRVYRNTDDFEMRISKECYKKIITALEKQISKKPNLWCGKIITCPNCLRAISQTEALDVHCKYCGQFMDWSDTDG